MQANCTFLFEPISPNSLIIKPPTQSNCTFHSDPHKWCQDWYAPYIASPQTDPIGPQSAVSRVVRGGCFFAGATKNRVSYRYCYSPTYSSNFIGLRLVLVP
ncbi:MAG: SUMF1/EgtB/PvdO family nonheme iron enzyme [Paludibacteraceae bacterium]|nr:SUMF1/EgtB/PvdO family nonheme iron enzyme [Paludibacteraceae bacterium]